MAKALRLPAIEVRQNAKRVLYTFAVDGKQITSFAAVSRIKRGDNQELFGYQRTAVLSHISEIRNYVEGESPMIPNAVVIAFDGRVKFEPARGQANATGYTRVGTLVIPATGEDDRPGFIVDGQQRVSAIDGARVESFPICVTAFITNDVREQTEQFILVNSTKPLPKTLIYELLPATSASLPTALLRRRFPAYLLEVLNHEEASPLRGMILTMTNQDGIIKDNSILRMLENSMSDGALYKFRYSDTGDGAGDVDAMLKLLSNFWTAVSQVFDDAWKLPPRRSRLMHGAGIVSMGFIMDAIAERQRETRIPTIEQFAADLLPLKPLCHWTQGVWDFGGGRRRKWNELQNTSKDIELLASYLLKEYKRLVWTK